MCDGSVFKEHPVFSHSARAIEIIAYYDEIELCNPLGSHTKVHKLGCLLFTIGNIHLKYRSQLKTMFLFSLAPVNVISKHDIRESVDSLCRDGADTPIVRVHWKAFLTREYSRFKPFSAREWPIRPLLYPTIPHK